MQKFYLKPMIPVLDGWDSTATDSCCRRLSQNFHIMEETHDGTEIKIIAPGVEREDLEMFSESNKVTVKVKKGADSDFLNWTKISFLVPEKYDIDSLSSKLERGILTINLEKKEKTKFHKIK